MNSDGIGGQQIAVYGKGDGNQKEFIIGIHVATPCRYNSINQ